LCAFHFNIAVNFLRIPHLFLATESYADSWTLVRAAMFSLNISKVLSGVKADVLFALGNAAIAGRNFNVRSRFKVIPRAVVVEL
jgi:hypothetical protein